MLRRNESFITIRLALLHHKTLCQVICEWFYRFPVPMGLFCRYCYCKSLYYSMTVGKCANCFCVIEVSVFLLPGAFE